MSFWGNIQFAHFHDFCFIVSIVTLLILYAYKTIKHYLISDRECTMGFGNCIAGKYCGPDGKCVNGTEGDSCYLGLAQCNKSLNCLPDFKCHRW